MIKGNNPHFFDSEEMEIIIEEFLFFFDFEYCDKALDYAISVFPQQAIFHILRAKKFRMEIEFEKAEEELRLVESQFPPSPELYKEKYVLNSILEDDPENYRLLLKAQDMDPKDPETQFFLSFEYLKRNQLGKAIDRLKFAIREDEEFAEKLYHFSYYFEHSANYSDALVFYSSLTDEFPLLKGTWFGLGLVYSWLGNHEEAINAYKYALSIDDDIPTAYYNIGNSYFDMEQYENAIQSYMTSWEIEQNDFNSIACIGDCYYKLGNFDMARDYYLKALELEPENVDALYGMINLCKESNNTAATRNYVMKAIKAMPNNFDLLFFALQLYDETLHEEKLIELFACTLELTEFEELHFEDFIIYCCTYEHYLDGLIIFRHYESHKAVSQMKDYFIAACYYLSGDIANGNQHLCNALMLNFKQYRTFLNLNSKLEEIPDIINLIEIFRS